MKYKIISYSFVIIIGIFLISTPVIMFYEGYRPLPTTLTNHIAGINTIAFSHNGKYIASGDQAGKILLWDVPSRKLINSWDTYQNEVFSLDFSKDDTYLVSGGTNSVTIWNIPDGGGFFGTGDLNGFLSVKFSPVNNKFAFSHISTGEIEIWEVDQWENNFILDEHHEPVFDMSFSPNGSLLASSSGSGQDLNPNSEIIIWDLNSHNEIMTLDNHTGIVFSVSFSEEGNKLMSAGEDGRVLFWDLASGEVTSEFKPSENNLNWVNFAVMSPDESTVALHSGYFSGSTPHSENKIALWDVAGPSLITYLEGHDGWVSDVAFAPDGKTLVSASYDKTIKFWDISNL